VSADPVVVVGAGPAGAAAACVLAGAGRRVLMLERERGTGHKVCGEFLGGPALARLAQLGIDVARLGAHPIGRVRIVRGRRQVERVLPFGGAGLSRRTLDAALRRRATELGAELRHGVRAVAVAPGEVAMADGKLRASAVMLATGKHELRGIRREGAHATRDLVGLKAHLRLDPDAVTALGGHVELFLLRDGYVGLQLVEAGLANLCLLTVPGRARLGWQELLGTLSAESAVLRSRLAGASPMWERPLAVARIPYGFVHSGAGPDGVYRLGDQMGVIPSFTGEGLAIALHTGMAAAGAVLAGLGANAFHRRMRRAVVPPIRLAGALHWAGLTSAGQAAIVAGARLPGALPLLARATRLAGAW